MKHKTWFRLVIKAIGIYMVCTSIPIFVSVVGSAIIQYRSANQLTAWSISQLWPSMVVQVLHWFAQFGIGLYLIFGGKWIADMAIPSNRPYCPECGYDLTTNASARCPECGVMLPPFRPSAD